MESICALTYEQETILFKRNHNTQSMFLSDVKCWWLVMTIGFQMKAFHLRPKLLLGESCVWLW